VNFQPLYDSQVGHFMGKVTVIPDASLIEATPDFVGLTDTAKILGCTRQNIRNLIFNGDTRSPSPVYEGTPSIWHLAEILTWLREDKTYSITSRRGYANEVIMRQETRLFSTTFPYRDGSYACIGSFESLFKKSMEIHQSLQHY
jgi:hypothetical protein